jgi:hypothetical protein
VGAIHVHEFMSLDGVIDEPTWTFGCGFDASCLVHRSPADGWFAIPEIKDLRSRDVTAARAAD